MKVLDQATPSALSLGQSPWMMWQWHQREYLREDDYTARQKPQRLWGLRTPRRTELILFEGRSTMAQEPPIRPHLCKVLSPHHHSED